MLMLCCVNAKCIASDGTLYPANFTIRDNFYVCGNNSYHNYYGNLEASLQSQAAQIKNNSLFNQTASSSSPVVFGYIEYNNAQLSYLSQNRFCKDTDTYSKYYLHLENVGLVDCYDGGTDGCNYQGPALYQYDFREQFAIDYFINNVTLFLLNYDSNKYLDGVFLDSISLWMHLCEPTHFNCTHKETNELYSAALNTLNQTLDVMNNSGYYVSVSSHTYNGSQNGLYYNATNFYFDMMNIMKNYNDISLRYWEEYEINTQEKFISFLWESQNNYKIQIHAGDRTMNPDWVELASFLIACNNQSWFSYSTGWMIESQWWQPEFANKLGNPLNGYQYPGSNCTKVYNNSKQEYTTFKCHREFEYCTVDFDLIDKYAKIDWFAVN